MAGDLEPRNERAHAPMVEHLEELRKRLIWGLLALVIGVSVGWVFAGDLYDLLTVHYLQIVAGFDAPPNLKAFGIAEIFMLQFRLGAYAGVVVALPVLLYQVLAFIVPALTPAEKRYIWTVLPATVVLFAAGVVFGYLVVVPLSVRFFIGVTQASGAELIFTAKQYFDLVTGICLPLGLAFEMPVVVWLLATLGVVTGKFLRRIWKYAILGIFVIAAFISPGSSVVDQVVMALPLLGLYEISIWVASFAERKRQRRLAADG